MKLRSKVFSRVLCIEAAMVAFAQSISVMPTVQYEFMENALIEIGKQEKEISALAKLLSDKLAEKSAKKSAEKITDKLSKRQKQILEYMEKEEMYSTEEIAVAIGLKVPRTRQLLKELIVMGAIECTASTKNRRYIKK